MAEDVLSPLLQALFDLVKWLHNRYAHPDIDLRRVRQWVREFSSVFYMPEIYNDLENILARQKTR